MAKLALVFNKKDCMGCHACEVACKQEHRLGVGPRLVRVVEKSADFLPIYCHHCTKAPCLAVCPADAIYRDQRGIVLINDELCIGCRECLDACPFGAMQFDDDREIAAKCDLCIARLDNGEQPACSMACATRCILWGDAGQLSERLHP